MIGSKISFQRRLRIVMAEQGISVPELAKRLEVSAASVYALLGRSAVKRQRVRTDTVGRYAKALGVSVESLEGE